MVFCRMVRRIFTVYLRFLFYYYLFLYFFFSIWYFSYIFYYFFTLSFALTFMTFLGNLIEQVNFLDMKFFLFYFFFIRANALDDYLEMKYYTLSLNFFNEFLWWLYMYIEGEIEQGIIILFLLMFILYLLFFFFKWIYMRFYIKKK